MLAGLEMQEKDREAVEEKQQEAASTLKGLRPGGKTWVDAPGKGGINILHTYIHTSIHT